MAIQIPIIDSPELAVRELKDQSVEAMPTPFEDTRRSPEDSPFAAAANVLSSVTKVAMTYKMQADAQATREAVNSYKQFNDSQMETVRQASGKDAAVAAQQMYDASAKEADRIKGTLTNGNQQQMFANAAMDEQTSLKRMAEIHVGQQVQVYKKQQLDGANAISLRRTTDNALDFGDAKHPGIPEQEAAETAARLDSYGKDQGMPPEAVQAMKAEQLSVLYGARVRTLLGMSEDPTLGAGALQAAQRVLNEHEKELGPDANALRAKVNMMALNAKADDTSIALAQKYKNPDGTVRTNDAIAEINTTYPAGPMRTAVRDALMGAANRAKEGVETQNNENWNALVGAWSKNGYSYSAVQTTKAWSDANNLQRDQIRLRSDAYMREQAGLPATRPQLRALGRLENDINDRRTYWGSVDNSVLDSNPDFNLLNTEQQKHITEMVAATHADRSNPEAQMSLAIGDIRARAVSNGILSKKIVGKPFDKWPEEDQQKWSELQSRVAPYILSWHADNANKGKFLSNEPINDFVDRVTRQGTIKNGHWFWIDQGGVSLGDSVSRPDDEQASHPFTPDIHDDEKSKGTEVQLKRGWDPQVTPSAFTNEELIKASSAWRQAQTGPSAVQRQKIIRANRANGVPNPESPEAVQATYEHTVLGYASRKRPPSPVQPVLPTPLPGLNFH